MLGLVFVDPAIKSLFDKFLMIIGLFMGVLGGLFVLGVLTRRANAFGALTGALVGAAGDDLDLAADQCERISVHRHRHHDLLRRRLPGQPAARRNGT
jgi:hypothetical protein